jgi:protein gp37
MIHSDPSEVRQHLELLRSEYELAVSIGLDADPAYMADLHHQLATWKAVWIGASVTELAVRRAGQHGRQQG